MLTSTTSPIRRTYMSRMKWSESGSRTGRNAFNLHHTSIHYRLSSSTTHHSTIGFSGHPTPRPDLPHYQDPCNYQLSPRSSILHGVDAQIHEMDEVPAHPFVIDPGCLTRRIVYTRLTDRPRKHRAHFAQIFHGSRCPSSPIKHFSTIHYLLIVILLPVRVTVLIQSLDKASA